MLTKRLVIREIEPNDLAHIHQLLILPETDRYNTLGNPVHIDETKKIVMNWLEDQKEKPRNNYTYLIEMPDKEFIGTIGLILSKPKYNSANVWYKLHVAQWGKGYATEAVKAMIAFGFDSLKLHRIEAGCAVDNIASYKVLEKAGMTLEGGRRKVLPIRGDWVDNYEYAILEDDMRPK